MALLLFAARFVREETTSHLFQPKDGEVVAIKSTLNGKYFEVSPTDGKLYATASRPVNKTALFRVMVLSRPMVDMLADAMRTTFYPDRGSLDPRACAAARKRGNFWGPFA